MTEPTPEWLTDDCPHWCSGDHTGQDHPDDRRHETPLITLPVVQRSARRDAENRMIRLVEADELDVAAVRDVGDAETWVVVVNDTQRLEVTVESARRVATALARVLDATGGLASEA